MAKESKAAEDLAFIRKIMDESRSFAEVGGDQFVVWGSVTGLAMLVTWGIAARYLPGTGNTIWALWFVALAVGFLLSYWRSRQQQRRPVSNSANRQIGAVWFAVGMPMLLLFFVGQSYELLRPQAIPATAAALLGTGVYLTGTLARIGWLRNLAFVWWVASIGLMLVHGATVFLVYGLLVLALYVLPGIKLSQMARRAGV
jgi:hypothetical protein